MDELERLIDEYERALIDFAHESREAYTTHYYMKVNKAKEDMGQAKQNLINYIEDSYISKH
jgi:hypothetical protein